MGDVFNMVSYGASSERGALVVRSVCDGCSVPAVSFRILNCRCDAAVIEGEAATSFDWLDPISRKKVTSRPKSEQPAVGGRTAACWRNAVRRNREERCNRQILTFFFGANPKGSPKHRARKIL